MATTTRAEDKTDKAIIRLLLDNPMGLTIGDITAQAKCSPLQARKSLARIKADKDASGQLYLLHDDDEQASEAAPEPAPEAQMPEWSKLLTVNRGGHSFLNPYADTSPTEPTDPAPDAPAPAPEEQPDPAPLPTPPAEVTLAPAPRPILTGLQQRILTMLGQHRGLTAQRIADDLHEPHLHVEQALLALGSRVTSRPLALPEIRVWECARASTEDVAHSTPLSEEEKVNFLSNVLRSNQCSLELRFPVSDQPIGVRITEHMEDGPVISEFELARDAYRLAIESAADPFDHFC